MNSFLPEEPTVVLYIVNGKVVAASNNVGEKVKLVIRDKISEFNTEAAPMPFRGGGMIWDTPKA